MNKYNVGDLVKMHEVLWDGKYGLIIDISPAEHDKTVTPLTAYYIITQMYTSPGWYSEDSIQYRVE